RIMVWKLISSKRLCLGQNTTPRGAIVLTLYRVTSLGDQGTS
uniref:Uncharacterized protein n=1 Tax=Triticum urartu TaxID=4572 RepID=A0A8R7QKJ4_TRIUA